MKIKSIIVVVFFFYTAAMFAQGFNVKASGLQKFTFNDINGRSQATFFSTTPLEDVSGLTTDIKGSVSFIVDSVVQTLQGKIIIPVSSLKTGIKKRDEDMKGSGWLDEDNYPDISFTIKKIIKIVSISNNKLKVDLTGDFLVHGVSNEINVEATIVYLDENEKTRQRAPGDLLGVTSTFSIVLSDYGVDNIVLGRRVSDSIEISINFVGSNK